PVFMEVCSALYPLAERPVVINKIYGLGGRDFLPQHAEEVLAELEEIARTGKVRVAKEYIGVRE
ncbi:MAG: pyruvate ferredoxin oxidoreductase, partial [Bacillota bacterium]